MICLNIYRLSSQEGNFFWYGFCVVSNGKENCDFHDIHIHLEPKTSEQLGQYLFLLKLSLLYTPRAIVTNVCASRDFVFTVDFIFSSQLGCDYCNLTLARISCLLPYKASKSY